MQKQSKKRGVIVSIAVLVAILIFSSSALAEKIVNSNYEVSVDKIDEKIKIESYKDFPVIIDNKRPTPISVYASLSDNITQLVYISQNTINLFLPI